MAISRDFHDLIYQHRRNFANRCAMAAFHVRPDPNFPGGKIFISGFEELAENVPAVVLGHNLLRINF
jgi:hypothetical protein